MWLLQKWRQVCKRWKLHIDSYTGPEGHWQRYLRIELQDLWLSLYRWATALVRNEDIESMNLGPYAELTLLSRDLGKALKLFGFSRELRAMSGQETELTITSNTMLWGLYRYGLHEFDGQVPPQIDQVTFIKMAGDELEKMKKTTHNPLTARPTPPTPVTKPQSSPSLAGDDT